MQISIPRGLVFAVMAAIIVALLIGGALFRIYLQTQARPPHTLTY